MLCSCSSLKTEKSNLPCSASFILDHNARSRLIIIISLYLHYVDDILVNKVLLLKNANMFKMYKIIRIPIPSIIVPVLTI